MTSVTVLQNWDLWFVLSQNTHWEAFLFFSEEVCGGDADNSKSLFTYKFFWSIMRLFKRNNFEFQTFWNKSNIPTVFLSNCWFIIKDNSLESFKNKTGINKDPYVSDWMSRFSRLQILVSTVQYIFRKSLTYQTRLTEVNLRDLPCVKKLEPWTSNCIRKISFRIFECYSNEIIERK